MCFNAHSNIPCRPKPTLALRTASSLRTARHTCRTNVPLRSYCRAGASRIQRLKVVAFRDASERPAAPAPRSSRSMAVSEHVSVPVDYYRLLQVPRVSRPDAIRKAYDTLVHQPPATAYSADTLFARAVLLKAAAESLTDPDLRRSYDAKLAAGHSALRVSQQDLPGTLVVLQEIGEFQLVLDFGSRWLELNGSQPDAGDVAAAVALAYCDRAGERLASPANQGAVLPACDDLDAALVKLRRYGMAKQLQTQIVSALRDLAPEYACELAALPLGPETAARRAKGVALMRGVLRSAAATVSRGGVTVGDPAAELLGADADPHSVVGHARRMLQRGRDVLTCGEQVSLLPDALRGSGPTPHPEVMYDGALACIVEGYRNGWPHSIHRADLLLTQLEEHSQKQTATQREKQDLAAAAAARGVQYSGAAGTPPAGAQHLDEAPAGAAGGEGPQSGNVKLERAVCSVLLGDYATAAALLGLTNAGAGDGGVAAPAADSQLRSFILEHMPSGTQDMRPGLRALATKWLEGVALASFRDTAGQPAMPLETSWFADPRVATYLQVRRASQNEQVLAVAHFLCNLLPNLITLLSALAIKVTSVAALVAARVQRIVATAAAIGAAAAAAAARRRSPRGASPSRSQPARSGPAAGATPSRLPLGAAEGRDAEGADIAGPTVAAAAAAPAPLDESVDEATTSAAVGRGQPAATPGPFGHPYGKTLRSTGAVPNVAPFPEVGASLLGTPRPADTVTARASPSYGTSVPTAAASVAIAAAAAGVASSSSAASGVTPDLRRRFAASAAVDDAVGLPATPTEAIDPHALELHDGDEDEHHADGADLADGDVDLDVTTSVPRRGMTEQDLRAHLAGLEAAMWDSEVPVSWASPQRLFMLVVGTAATVAALFLFAFRRSGDGMAPTRSPGTPPAVVSITVSAFVAPN